MTVLVSHPTGNANLRAVLRGLDGADALAEFWTTLSLPPDIARATWLPRAVRRKLSQRSFSEARWGITKLRPLREMTRLTARRVCFQSLIGHEASWASVDAVYRDLDKAVARRLLSRKCTARAVYAYEDGAYSTFLAARNTRHLRIYDLPIAHWRTVRRLLEEEAERLPDWAPTMQGLRDSVEKCARKDAEIELSDRVIVASSFTRDSVRAAHKDVQVHVTAYGCPPPSNAEPARRAAGSPIELLFAGHLEQRKGIADLIAALSMLEVDWRLTLAGPRPVGAPRALEEVLGDPRVTWLGTVPHATLMERMAHAHVFVFPSIVEGFGLVITEALAAGLPVVTTPNTAGPDILREGGDGFIVPIRSPEALADRIVRLAEDETLRRSMAAAAKTKARELSWARYEAQVADLVTGWLTSA